jgi:ABC-type branched-subunit amino acid transport system substrate-binding protein
VLAAEQRLSEPAVVKIGMLLPLQNGEGRAREKEIGQGLREGIETAHAELMGKVAVVLEARSSSPDPVAPAKQFAEDASTIAIIGPAFSGEAQAVTAVATQYRIPLITPTANANGIAAASEFMFQANPDIETRAKAIAQHAVIALKLKRLAILGANEQSSKLLAESFTKEVERLGGEEVATEWYARGETNLLKQLTRLRRKGNAAASDPFIAFNESITNVELAKLAKLGISKKVLDTLKAKRRVVNMTEFLGNDAKAKLNMQTIPYSNGDPRIDSVQRIVTAVQGIYCPIASGGEIGVISSQLAFYGISTKVLGSGEWNNPSELNASQRYTRGVFFETDYYVDTKSSVYASFAARYMQRYNKVPSKFAILGYDTAKLLLTLIQQGATTREQVRDALSRVNSFEGLHAKISFDKRRVNSWLQLFQFTKDGLTRVAEISVE